MLSNSHAILNVSEGSQHPNARFFLPKGRQNDKMIVISRFETPPSFISVVCRLFNNDFASVVFASAVNLVDVNTLRQCAERHASDSADALFKHL